MRRYREEGGDPGDWDSFKSHAAGGSYRELISRLLDLQHRLCAYCEIELTESDRSVEHVTPRSDPEKGRDRTLDPQNLVACCRGGERPFGANGRRYRKPIRKNRSCGAAKGDAVSSSFVDPRCLPASPPVVRVLSDGTVEAAEQACRAVGVSPEHLSRTIGLLNLNCPRLRTARRDLFEDLDSQLADYLDNREGMDRVIRAELLRAAGARHEPFFSTRRSYFRLRGHAETTEAILAESPPTWV